MPIIESLPLVRLTIAQRLVVQWAAEAMTEYWQDVEERRAEGNEPVFYPVMITNKGALIMGHRGVLEDLKYRLLEQYPDVVDEMEHCPRIATIRAAENAWLAIAKVAADKGLVVGAAARSSRILEEC
jgi:hypothetical protein